MSAKSKNHRILVKASRYRHLLTFTNQFNYKTYRCPSLSTENHRSSPSNNKPLYFHSPFYPLSLRKWTTLANLKPACALAAGRPRTPRTLSAQTLTNLVRSHPLPHPQLGPSSPTSSGFRTGPPIQRVLAGRGLAACKGRALTLLSTSMCPPKLQRSIRRSIRRTCRSHPIQPSTSLLKRSSFSRRGWTTAARNDSRSRL